MPRPRRPDSSSRASGRSRPRRSGGKGNGKAIVIRGARENNLKSDGRDASARHVGRHHRRLGIRQEHAGQRDSLQGALEASRRHADAAWRSRRPSTASNTSARSSASISRRSAGTAARIQPRTSASTTASAISSPQTPLSVERGYRPGRFSFNVKGGRCEECQGEGVITTQLYFMPDVEVTCGACKGSRFNSETLEVTLRGKTIDDVLSMSIEGGRRLLRSRTGDRQEDPGARRSRARAISRSGSRRRRCLAARRSGSRSPAS